MYRQTTAGIGLTLLGGMAALGLTHTLSSEGKAAHDLNAKPEITASAIDTAQHEDAMLVGKVAGEVFVAGTAGSIGVLVLKRSLHELDVIGG